MCDTKKLADEICDYIAAPFGIGLNEHVRESVALKIAEALKHSHNSSRDAIFAAANEWDDGHHNRAAINGFVAGVEWSQKQHQ
jgi:hypothetical protein